MKRFSRNTLRGWMPELSAMRWFNRDPRLMLHEAQVELA